MKRISAMRPGTSGGAPPGQASQGWTLGLTSLAYFMCALDGLVVVTALPAIGRNLHASASLLQWTVNGYGIPWAAGMITAAAVADLIGRKKMFLIGLVIFSAASAACAVAPNMTILITARAFQGAGASIILPISLTILVGVFPKEKRSTVVGIWGGIGGLAIAGGPLVGGALTQSLNWHWVFWLNVPIGVVVALLARFRLVETRGPGRRLDLPGVGLTISGAAITIWALVQSGPDGWGSPQVIAGLLTGCALIAAFIVWESRAPEPMIPLRLFRSTVFSAANLTSFMMAAALLAAGVYVSQYFQFVRGDSPLVAGAAFLPMMAMPLLITPLSGVVADRIGQRPLIVGGAIIETIGLVWFADTAGVATAYSALVLPLALAGLGFSMALMTTPAAALSAAPLADL